MHICSGSTHCTSCGYSISSTAVAATGYNIGVRAASSTGGKVRRWSCGGGYSISCTAVAAIGYNIGHRSASMTGHTVRRGNCGGSYPWGAKAKMKFAKVAACARSAIVPRKLVMRSSCPIHSSIWKTAFHAVAQSNHAKAPTKNKTNNILENPSLQELRHDAQTMRAASLLACSQPIHEHN